MAEPTLSVVMIVRDEAERLPRCLASVRGGADEIVVVDTGSVDDTPAIAASFGARVLHRAWDGSFSSARNASLDAAGGDWVLVLDADEAVVDIAAMKAAVAEAGTAVEGFILPMVNFVGEHDHEEAVVSPAVRLFRNRPAYRYSRALHEQILSTLQTTVPGAEVNCLDCAIEHYGYLTGVVADRDKVTRNLALAEEEARRYPDDAFSWYNLGQEHYRMCRWDDALAAFQHGFAYLETLGAGYAPSLVKHLVVCLLSLNRCEEALAVLEDALQVYPSFSDLWALQGHALSRRLRWAEGRAAYAEALEHGDVESGFFMSDEGVGSYKALWWLGICDRQLGHEAEAEASWLEALGVQAQRRRYVGTALDLLIGLWKDLGRPLETLVAAVDERVSLGDERWRELFAARLIEAGLREAGEELLAGCAAPRAATCTALARARLAGGDVNGALAALALVPPDSRDRLTADWTALLAYALAGDLDRAAALFHERVARRGEAPLVALYRGLLPLWRGASDVPTPLLSDRERVEGHVLSLLRTMLAAGAVELARRTAPALGWVGRAPAEQAALMGDLYHRAGLDAPAIEALATAVEAGDRRAETWQLLGLLCLRRGAHAEAEGVLFEAMTLQDEAGLDPRPGAAWRGWRLSLAAQGREHEADETWRQWKNNTARGESTRTASGD
jgi:glycosyltransferase involved in cell wall biosynthesis